MENTELLEAIGRMMDEKLASALQPINARLDKVDGRLDNIDRRLDRIEEDIEDLKESCEITRGVTNALLDWTERVSVIDTLPLPKVIEE